MQVPACSYPSTNNPDISFFFFTLPRAGNIVKFEGFVWRLRGFLIGEIRIYHEDAKFSLFSPESRAQILIVIEDDRTTMFEKNRRGQASYPRLLKRDCGPSALVFAQPETLSHSHAGKSTR